LDSNPGIAELEKRIKQLFEAPKTQPMSRSELARALEVPSGDRGTFAASHPQSRRQRPDRAVQEIALRSASSGFRGREGRKLDWRH